MFGNTLTTCSAIATCCLQAHMEVLQCNRNRRCNAHMDAFWAALFEPLPDKALMHVRATGHSQRSVVDECLRARMCKRLPRCIFANKQISFAFSLYVGLMRAPRQRSPAGVIVTCLRPQDPDDSHLEPLLYNLADDDPEPSDNEGWGVAMYCGYYGSRFMKTQCYNDASERRRVCSVCEILCCEESCLTDGRICCHCAAHVNATHR